MYLSILKMWLILKWSYSKYYFNTVLKILKMRKLFITLVISLLLQTVNAQIDTTSNINMNLNSERNHENKFGLVCKKYMRDNHLSVYHLSITLNNCDCFNEPFFREDELYQYIYGGDKLDKIREKCLIDFMEKQ